MFSFARARTADRRRPALLGITVPLLMLALAPTASAATLHVAEDAAGPAPCDLADPCRLADAITLATDGDEVLLAPGTYDGDDTDGMVDLSKGIVLRGSGSGTSKIEGAFTAVRVRHQDAVVEDLSVESFSFSGFNHALVLEIGRAERVLAHGTGTAGACLVRELAVLRESVCWAEGAAGVRMIGSPAAPTGTIARLVGVTAIGSHYGIEINSFVRDILVEGTNVIASGGTADVLNYGSSPMAIFDHSNYDTAWDSQPDDPSTPPSGGVTPPGTGTNQTAPPLFTDSANGDFSALPGSPVIDAGDSFALGIGAQDVTGAPRVQGASADTGAHEFAPPPPPTNHDPSCADAAPSVSTVGVRDHRWVSINITGLSDVDGDSLTVATTGIRQDEAVDEKGSGNTSPDGRGVGTATPEVRAERSGKGNGRVYHIAFAVSDGQGGQCSGTVRVAVPHSDNGRPAVDGGPLYDSTQS